ncbi:MAG: hypothetical protein M3347_10355, partial [Armatimonadota bacterium]|nr:hypothetical protein [Armatimonadota bacterium]
MNVNDLDASIFDESIERGLEFLRRSQLPSGEFKLYGSPDMAMERERVLDSSPFATSLVAYSLGFADWPQAQALVARALQSLRADMELPGMWRHWTKNDLYQRYLPPDADDIACASYLLRRYGVFEPKNRALLLANRSREGLFYTWFIPRFAYTLEPSYWRVTLREAVHPRGIANLWKTTPATPNDVDGVVNANVLFYLGESQLTQPVIDYLIRTIQRQEEDSCDKWYGRYMFYYALSRNFFAGVTQLETVRDEVIRRIVQDAREDGSIGDNVLETAIAVCSLLNWHALPAETHRAVQLLISTQRAA